MIDFAGQICSEAIGLKQYSGVGGQLSFVEGAYSAENGKSVMCLKATATVDGKLVSNIVPTFPPGSIVTTPRHYVQYVVTEFGIANLVVWPKVFEAHRRIVMGSRLLGVRGHVQREGLVIHLVAEELWDWSGELDSIAEIDEDFRLPHGRGDEVRSDPGDRCVMVPEANATRHRVKKGTPAKGHDRSRIHLDRPKIKIASRDFH
jgi:hypothetical protein